MNILQNKAAMANIKKSNQNLLAPGMPNIIAPADLPQGMTVSLHVATSEYARYAAYTALEEGAGLADQESTHTEFNAKVAAMAANFAISDADAKQHPQGQPSWS